MYYVYISDEVEIKELCYPCECGRDVYACTFTMDFVRLNVVVAYNFRRIILFVFFCNKVFSCWISKLNKWCVSSCSLVRNSEVLFRPSATDGTCEWKMSHLGHPSTWTAGIHIIPEAEHFILQDNVWTSWGPYAFSLLSIG